MKSFAKFIEEVTYLGNKGLPDDFMDKTKGKASKDYQVRPDDVSQEGALQSQMASLMARSNSIMWSGSKEEGDKRAKKLVQLAKDVIMSEYESILDNVDLEIKLVRGGEVISEVPKLGDVPITPKTQAEQKEELKKDQEKSKERKDPPKSSLANKLSKLKGPPRDELAALLNSEEVAKKIDKGKLTNAIIQGEGKNTKNLLHSEKVKDGLSEIFGEQADNIFKIWDELTKVANKMDWAIPVAHKVEFMKKATKGFAGAVEVKWPETDGKEEGSKEEGPEEGPNESNLKPSEYKVDSKDAQDILKKIQDGGDINENEEDISELLSTGNPKIFVVGVDFPMLLHETVKGIYLLIARAGIPEDKRMATIVKMNVSTFEDEAEDFKYGPYIAGALRDMVNSCPGSDKYPNIREHVFGRMLLMSDDPFLKLMKGILEGKEEAKKTITDIISEINEEIKEWEISNIGNEPEPERGEREPKEDEDDITKLIRKTQHQEPESEEEVDIKKMTPEQIKSFVSGLKAKELQKIIDDALDSGDYETLGKLQPFMKESFEWKIYESEIKRILK